MERGSTVRPRLMYGLYAVTLVAALFLSVRFLTPHAQARPVIQVRWLISHQPADVFARATRIFADELSKETEGEMALTVVTPEELGLPATGDVSESKISELLQSGVVDLASPYTAPLGTHDADFWSINLPFLFSNYDQVNKSIDGPAGMHILQGLSSKSGEHGLAFTMSGGFRVIASKDTKISSPADLRGKRIATSGGPVAETTLKALGAIPVSLDLESGATPDLSHLDGVETTYARLSGIVGRHSKYTTYINETNHSLFLTALVSSNSFYDSLSPENQAALEKAALTAARAEREDSIALNAKTKMQLAESGSVITTLTPDEREAFKHAVQPVYKTFPELISLFGQIGN